MLSAGFKSVDPINGSADNPLSWNAYSYAGNNPIKFIDPSGMLSDSFGGRMFMAKLNSGSGYGGYNPFDPESMPPLTDPIWALAPGVFEALYLGNPIVFAIFLHNAPDYILADFAEQYLGMDRDEYSREAVAQLAAEKYFPGWEFTQEGLTEIPLTDEQKYKQWAGVLMIGAGAATAGAGAKLITMGAASGPGNLATVPVGAAMIAGGWLEISIGYKAVTEPRKDAYQNFLDALQMWSFGIID